MEGEAGKSVRGGVKGGGKCDSKYMVVWDSMGEGKSLAAGNCVSERSFAHCVCFASVCKRWQRLAIMSWRSMKRLSFDNMFKSIFRAGKHCESSVA